MIDDDGKLRQKFLNKDINARKEGIGFDLTWVQFVGLVKKAGLVSSDLGFTGRNYVLARFNDEGDYTKGNCRFITQRENMAEQQKRPKSKKQIQASRSAIKLAMAGHSTKSLARAGRKGAATRHLQVAEELVKKDQSLSKVKVRKRFVALDTWGWKTRLSKELGITTGELRNFLLRQPTYTSKL